MSRPIFLLLKALEAGQRWITIHPNGKDAPGQAVLIQQQPDGAAKVVGGAGGSLNHLRLTGVKSAEHYKQEAGERSQKYRADRKEQQAKDKAAGLTKGKAAAKDALKEQLGEQRAATVQKVADAYGWDTSFPEHQYQNVSESARTVAKQKFAAALVQRTKEAIKFQKQALVASAEQRDEAGIGEVPLTSATPDQISAADLLPVAPLGSRGLGFQPDYAKRAEAAGLTTTEQKREAKAANPNPSPDVAQASKDRAAAEAKIADELATVADPLPQLDAKKMLDAGTALDLVKAGKELAAAEKSAREQTKKINRASEPVEPKAYVLETSAVSDEDALKGLESELRTVRTSAFLSDIGKLGFNRESVGGHVASGAYNSINALALAAGGSAMLDRSTVDVLGVDGAAQVLARRLASDLTPDEMSDLRDGMEAFHKQHYMDTQDSSLRDARLWHEMASEIEVGSGATGHELTVAQELNARRREYTGNAMKVLGTALGEMEGNAALVAALGRKKPQDRMSVSMGKVAPEHAVAQARAIGLQRGEYRIERVGASTMLTIEGAGMDRLAKPVSRADLERSRATMDIVSGRSDEPNWLPQGVARRLDLGRDDMKPGVAPSLAEPFKSNPEDVRQAVRDYIGGRAADGDTAPDILAGLLNEETVQKAGDRDAFFKAVDEIAPSKDAEGKMIRAEAHEGKFAELADDFTEKHLGGKIPSLHRQRFEHDDIASDALHRALTETPEGAVAFKQIGDLTPQDQGMLRSTFAQQFAQTAGPEAQAKQTKLAELDGAEPEREVQDMFGTGENPVWRDWKAERDGLAEDLNRSSMTWGKYLGVMGSPQAAYQSMQDVIRSKVVRSFAENMNLLKPDAPLKIGRTTIRNDIDHLGALDPEARERRQDEARRLAGALQARTGGKFAADDVKGKMLRTREAEAAIAQSQMGMFGFEEPAPAASGDDAAALPELRAGERYTIGHQSEGDLAKLMGRVGANFRPGTAPIKELWQANMSGKFAGRQRAVKLIEANKRVALGLGVGSGKTSIALASFAHLKSQGKAKRGLFIVPSIAQGQFHGEALTVLDPGKFKWDAEPGQSRDERIASYKNPESDFQVVTHAAFRDDMLHLAAARDGSTPTAVADKLDKMDSGGRADFMRDLMQHEGIDHDYMAVDEGHQLLNREGKANSRMANVTDAAAHNSPYYVSMTADPTKNDVSEAFDLLHKMDPVRYADRPAFMRKYGVDTPAAADELKREMARHLYSDHITPDVQVTQTDVHVPLGAGEKAQLKKVDEAAGRARLARMKGETDLDALKELAPGAFAHVPEEQHEDVAKELNKSIGILHSTAEQHAISSTSKVSKIAELAKERKGKPGVVFAHSLTAVAAIADKLRAEGHKVVTLTGSDDSKAKAQVKADFEAGRADVIVSSDAGAVGANWQHGRWLAQFDTPTTAMVHAQRRGRINRIGQKNPVELLDLIADHPAEAKARKRLADKYGLRDIMSSPMDGLDDRGIAGFLNRKEATQAEEQAPLFAPTQEEEPGTPGSDDDPVPEGQGGFF